MPRLRRRPDDGQKRGNAGDEDSTRAAPSRRDGERGRDARADAGLANINYRKLQVDFMAPNHGEYTAHRMLWVHSPAMEAARVSSRAGRLADGAILAAKSNNTLARSLPIMVATRWRPRITWEGREMDSRRALLTAFVGLMSV